MEENVKSLEKKSYIAPKIEVIEIEVEQSIFAGSGDLLDMPGSDW